MNPGIDNYLKITKKHFNAQRDPEYAAKMKAYMRNQFEYIGMTSSRRREIQRNVISEAGVPEMDHLQEIVYEFWKMPEREYQYFAMHLLERRIKLLPHEALKFIEELVLFKSWWDTIDFLSPTLAGSLFKKYPDQIRPVTRRWMDSGNIWLQRSCILFQLKYKKNTDLKLLYSFIDQLSDSKEFFIKKSIGWILREYSKIDPAEVKSFVESRKLQPLSVREAMKYVDR